MRLATYPHWYWISLDWIIRDYGVDYKRLVRWSWDESRKYENPDYEFTTIFSYYIHCYVQRIKQEEYKNANDDFYRSARRRETSLDFQSRNLRAK